MLHFVIGCAIIVGCFYQWILPERRRKQQEAGIALGFRLLEPEPHDHMPEGRRELNRLRRRAGLPIEPEAQGTSGVLDGAMRFLMVAGALCVAALCFLANR